MLLLKDLDIVKLGVAPEEAERNVTLKLGTIPNHCATSYVYKQALWYAWQIREWGYVCIRKPASYTNDLNPIDWPVDLMELPHSAYDKKVAGKLSVYLDIFDEEAIVEFLRASCLIKRMEVTDEAV